MARHCRFDRAPRPRLRPGTDPKELMYDPPPVASVKSSDIQGQLHKCIRPPVWERVDSQGPDQFRARQPRKFYGLEGPLARRAPGVPVSPVCHINFYPRNSVTAQTPVNLSLARARQPRKLYDLEGPLAHQVPGVPGATCPLAAGPRWPEGSFRPSHTSTSLTAPCHPQGRSEAKEPRSGLTR